jgi:ubiquinone/menaquinone biosynthesis C-methylase UbiE
MTSGSFSQEDTTKIQKSVRKDGNWYFFKKHIKAYHAQTKDDITICELGAGAGDVVFLIRKTLPFVTDYYAIEESDLADQILDAIVRRSNIEDCRFPNADMFLSKNSFHHIVHKQKVLDAIYDKLPKGGKLLVIDRFAKWGQVSIWIERLWDKLNIKNVLGTHYMVTYSNFKQMCEEAGFEITFEKVKKPKKLKTFFIEKNQLVLEK